jgi:hypothetical protein
MSPATARQSQSEWCRADTLALKQRLAELMPLEQGELYWEAFGSFLTGKSTREEFERSTGDLLKDEIGKHISPARSLQAHALS